MTTARRVFVLAAAAFALLGAVSADAWCEARRLQHAADRAYAIESAQRALRSVGPQQPLQRALDRLLHDPALGFRFLALRDARGGVRAAAGRYEHGSLPGVPADVALQLREVLYALTSTHETITLKAGAGAEAPTLEFALGAPEQRAWREETLSRLLRFSVLGIALAITGLMALIYFLRQRNPIRLPPRPRADAPVSPNGGDRDLLDQAALGLVRVDRALRIQALNKTAESLSGWSAADALDQQIFTVVRLRDGAGQPMDPALTGAWQGATIQPLQTEGWLQPRQGERRRMDIIATVLRDVGGITGGALLLKEAGRRYAETEKRAQDARLPQSLMDRLDEGVLHTDAAGVIRYANQRLHSMLGYTPEALQGESIGKLLPVPFLNQSGWRLADYAARAADLPAVVACHRDGTQITVELVVETLPAEGGLVVMLRPKKP